MLYCQRCRKIVDEDLVFCPECRDVLIEDHVEWQHSELLGEVEAAKHRANMYVILAIVLVTLGMMGSSVLFASSSLLGLLGIAFVCLGVGCTAMAYRYQRKARSLKSQLRRCA